MRYYEHVLDALDRVLNSHLGLTGCLCVALIALGYVIITDLDKGGLK